MPVPNSLLAYFAGAFDNFRVASLRARVNVYVWRQRTTIGLGTIDAGTSTTAEVAILPRPRAQPLATAQQNEYELSFSLSSDEVRGVYATLVFAPKVAAAAAETEEGVPPTGGEEVARAPAFVHGFGYIVAGNNVHVGTYSFSQAKAKFAQLVASAQNDPRKTPVGFTFRSEDAEPAEGVTVYFKTTTRVGASSKWQHYLAQ